MLVLDKKPVYVVEMVSMKKENEMEMDVGVEDEEVVLVTEGKKWFSVDFNVPGRTVLVAKPECPEENAKHLYHHSKLPEVGEHAMLYTFDDLEPFAFEAEVIEVDEKEYFWIVRFREFGPYFHWRPVS